MSFINRDSWTYEYSRLPPFVEANVGFHFFDVKRYSKLLIFAKMRRYCKIFWKKKKVWKLIQICVKLTNDFYNRHGMYWHNLAFRQMTREYVNAKLFTSLAPLSK